MLHPTRLLLLLALPLATSACGDDTAPGPDGGAPADAPGDGADGGRLADADSHPDALPGADHTDVPRDVSIAWFEPDRILQIDIQMDPIAWQNLSEQGRDFQSMFDDPMCLAQPFDSPFSYFPGTITVNGHSAANVGVRKKGFFGSLDTQRPSLKIKTHEYVPDQTLAGEKRITLNNSIQDASLARTCLAFHVFRELGLAAPLCNFARVGANGRDLGLYVHVEEVKKPFLRRSFTNPDGALFEGTLSDFRPEWLGSFEDKADTPVPEHRAALEALTEAAARPDGEVEAALAELVDLDEFLLYWAAEAFLAHWDGYSGNTNNYFVYQDPGDRRFHFIPWGPDSVYTPGPFLPLGVPDAVYATGVIAHRLYQLPAVRLRYYAELRRILDVLDEASLFEYLDRLQALLAPHVPDRTAFEAEHAELRAFMTGHRARLEAALAEAAREWPIPLRGVPCFHTTGPLTLELDTTFGTLAASNPFETGTGQLQVDLDGVALSASAGSAAGLGTSGDEFGDVVLVGLAVFPSGFTLLSYLVIEPELVAPGAILDIDEVAVRGALFRAVSPVFDYQLQGIFTGGTVEILEGTVTSSATFRARIEAEIYSTFRL